MILSWVAFVGGIFSLGDIEACQIPLPCGVNGVRPRGVYQLLLWVSKLDSNCPSNVCCSAGNRREIHALSANPF